MAEVKLEIAGRSYAIACRDGSEARIEALGADLGRRAEQLVAQIGPQPEGRLLLMVALMVADQLHEAAPNGAGAGGPTVAPEAEAVLARLAARVEAMADRLEAALAPRAEAG